MSNGLYLEAVETPCSDCVDGCCTMNCSSRRPLLDERNKPMQPVKDFVKNAFPVLNGPSQADAAKNTGQ